MRNGENGGSSPPIAEYARLRPDPAEAMATCRTSGSGRYQRRHAIECEQPFSVALRRGCGRMAVDVNATLPLPVMRAASQLSVIPYAVVAVM